MAVYNSGISFLAGDVIQPTGIFILMGFHGYNAGPQQYIMLFDAAAVPNTGALGYVIWQILPGSFAFNFAPIGNLAYARQTSIGRPFFNGMCWSNSTTVPTLTQGGANIWLSVDYA